MAVSPEEYRYNNATFCFRFSWFMTVSPEVQRYNNATLLQPFLSKALVIRHSNLSSHTFRHSANRTCWGWPAVDLSIWGLKTVITALNIRTGCVLVQRQAITNTFAFVVSKFLVCMGPSVERQIDGPFILWGFLQGRSFLVHKYTTWNKLSRETFRLLMGRITKSVLCCPFLSEVVRNLENVK
jgi:hypothetical protein